MPCNLQALCNSPGNTSRCHRHDIVRQCLSLYPTRHRSTVGTEFYPKYIVGCLTEREKKEKTRISAHQHQCRDSKISKGWDVSEFWFCDALGTLLGSRAAISLYTLEKPHITLKQGRSMYEIDAESLELTLTASNGLVSQSQFRPR